MDRSTQGNAQLGPRELEEIERRFAATHQQIAPRALGEVNDGVHLVDDERRRPVFFEEPQMQIDGGEPAARLHASQIGYGCRVARFQAGKNRRPRRDDARHLAALEQVDFLVDGREEVRAFGRLGGAEEKVSAGLEGEVQHLHGAVLRGAVEIDEDIAAGNEVEVREGRIFDQVVSREQHDLAQLAPYAEAVVLVLLKVAAQTLGRHIGDFRIRIGALARFRDRVFVEVRAEYLHVGRGGHPGHGIGEQHGH